MNYLMPEQFDQLLQPINKVRINKKDGMSHLEAYDVRAHMNRIFGFGRWSSEVISMDLVNERFGQNRGGKDACYVVYRAGLRLTVCAPDGTQLAVYTEYAAGDALGFPIIKLGDAHDFAMKTAESQALKRAATNLGDQFGLSLYNKGGTGALVRGSLVKVHKEDQEAGEAPMSVDEDIPEIHPEGIPLPDEVGEHPGPQPPVPPVGESPMERFQAQFEIVKHDVDGLNALWKWARNSSAPENIINQIKGALAALDQAA